MIIFTEEEFSRVREKGEEIYKNIGDIYCPYFKEKIAFNNKGIEHIKYKRRENPRSNQDQYMRYKLIDLAPKILNESHTVQGIEETHKFERVRVNSRTDTILKPVSYFEFIAVIKRNRVRIIVKQIDGGNKFFWSIIPFWGMDTININRILHSGHPEED